MKTLLNSIPNDLAELLSYLWVTSITMLGSATSYIMSKKRHEVFSIWLFLQHQVVGGFTALLTYQLTNLTDMDTNLEVFLIGVAAANSRSILTVFRNMLLAFLAKFPGGEVK